jgi:hypothetical protein
MSHLRMAAKDRMESGERPGEAGLPARSDSGNAGLVKEVARGMWGRHWLNSGWHLDSGK